MNTRISKSGETDGWADNVRSALVAKAQSLLDQARPKNITDPAAVDPQEGLRAAQARLAELMRTGKP